MKLCRQKLLEKIIEHIENFESQTPFNDFLTCLLSTNMNEIHQLFR